MEKTTKKQCKFTNKIRTERILYADVSEYSVRSIFIGREVSMKMEQIECSETSEYKIQTPGNRPK